MGETSRNVPHDGGTPCPTHTTPSAALTHVAPAHQWVSTTESRHAGDPYSWMQAVHWIHGSGLYTKRRSHGPGFGDTTVRVAQALAQLTPCRPGVDYLARVLRMSERSVQYHLEMLRETGLLAYITRGTRISGIPNQASEFARVIPPCFDTALGIRTIGEGVQRRPVGIAEEHRGSIAKLARKAACKIRKRRRNTNRRGTTAPSAAAPVCTPSGGGTSTSSSADVTTDPPEAKRASGNSQSPTPKKPNRSNSRKPRTLNKVGRRHQLARQLHQRVWWLNRAAVPRIAWIIRDVADAGWTADEVIAWLNLDTDPGIAHRPSGFLAYRLRAALGAIGWRTPEQRAHQVEIDRDTRRAEHHRHTETTGQPQAPNSRYVQRLVADAIHQMRRPGPATAAELDTTDQEQGPLALEDLTRAEVLDLRATADRDPDVIGLAIDLMGERDARRLYTNHRVNQYLRPAPAHMTLGA